MKCPACRSELLVVERDSIEVDWCLECGGLWFDEGELELLGEKAGRSIDPEDVGFETTAADEKLRRCPRCPQRMAKIALADGQLIDRCRDHGIWLDRGELAEIIRHLPPLPPLYEPVAGEDTPVVGEDTSAVAVQDTAVVLDFLGEVFEHTTETPNKNPEGRA